MHILPVKSKPTRALLKYVVHLVARGNLGQIRLIRLVCNSVCQNFDKNESV